MRAPLPTGVTAELPGVEAKDLTLELTKDAVLLRGEKKHETEVEREGYLRFERRYGAFFREIPLPWEVDLAKTTVKPTFEHGVLTLEVPKPKEVLSAVKKIEIPATSGAPAPATRRPVSSGGPRRARRRGPFRFGGPRHHLAGSGE